MLVETAQERNEPIFPALIYSCKWAPILCLAKESAGSLKWGWGRLALAFRVDKRHSFPDEGGEPVLVIPGSCLPSNTTVGCILLSHEKQHGKSKQEGEL